MTLVTTRADLISYYFKKDALLVLTSVQAVRPNLFGKYELSDRPENEIKRAAGEYLIVDQSGIYLEKNRLLTISKEEVRENSKYRVSGGWLHGVIPNDSLPCALDGETYYFLTPAKTYLFDVNTSPNRLIQITASKYALFSHESNGHFSVVVANFVTGGVQLNEVVLSNEDPNNISKIEKKEEELTTDDGIKTFILSPSKEEWETFIFSKCLSTYDSYTRMAP